MKKYKLPKEFAEKWLAALRSGDYVQGGGVLLSYEEIDDEEVDINKKSYCCLGVACALTDASESEYSGKTFVDTKTSVSPEFMIEKGYPKELVGDSGLPHILSMLNDGIKRDEFIFENYFSELILRRIFNFNSVYQLSFPEIADFIEDNVEFY